MMKKVSTLMNSLSTMKHMISPGKNPKLPKLPSPVISTVSLKDALRLFHIPPQDIAVMTVYDPNNGTPPVARCLIVNKESVSPKVYSQQIAFAGKIVTDYLGEDSIPNDESEFWRIALDVAFLVTLGVYDRIARDGVDEDTHDQLGKCGAAIVIAAAQVSGQGSPDGLAAVGANLDKVIVNGTTSVDVKNTTFISHSYARTHKLYFKGK